MRFNSIDPWLLDKILEVDQDTSNALQDNLTYMLENALWDDSSKGMQLISQIYGQEYNAVRDTNEGV